MATIEPVVQPLRHSRPHRIGGALPPVDEEAAGLLEVDEAPSPIAPVLDEQTHHTVQRLLLERQEADRLRLAGVSPSSTVLLSGPPGVGKTITATWLAAALGLPLLRLQASAVMSSLLGQSARNLASALDFARSQPAVLLLDEFDAYARRRDDHLDIAEPKRLVNSLLMELEDWPDTGMLVAATNHLEVLDPAIERRFDVHVRLPLPDERTRRRLLDEHLSRLGWMVDGRLLEIVAIAQRQATGSDLARLSRNAIRDAVLDEVPIDLSVARVFLPGALADRTRANAQARRSLVSFADERLAINDGELAALAGVSERTVAEVRGRAESSEGSPRDVGARATKPRGRRAG